jgi:hypothetical protein
MLGVAGDVLKGQGLALGSGSRGDVAGEGWPQSQAAFCTFPPTNRPRQLGRRLQCRALVAWICSARPSVLRPGGRWRARLATRISGLRGRAEQNPRPISRHHGYWASDRSYGRRFAGVLPPVRPPSTPPRGKWSSRSAASLLWWLCPHFPAGELPDTVRSDRGRNVLASGPLLLRETPGLKDGPPG